MGKFLSTLKEYWPIIVYLVTAISGYATLKADVEHLKQGAERRREWAKVQQRAIRQLEIDVTKLQIKND